jgi:hypothetical protein
VRRGPVGQEQLRAVVGVPSIAQSTLPVRTVAHRPAAFARDARAAWWGTVPRLDADSLQRSGPAGAPHRARPVQRLERHGGNSRSSRRACSTPLTWRGRGAYAANGRAATSCPESFLAAAVPPACKAVIEPTATTPGRAGDDSDNLPARWGNGSGAAESPCRRSPGPRRQSDRRDPGVSEAVRSTPPVHLATLRSENKRVSWSLAGRTVFGLNSGESQGDSCRERDFRGPAFRVSAFKAATRVVTPDPGSSGGESSGVGRFTSGSRLESRSERHRASFTRHEGRQHMGQVGEPRIPTSTSSVLSSHFLRVSNLAGHHHQQHNQQIAGQTRGWAHTLAIRPIRGYVWELGNKGKQHGYSWGNAGVARARISSLHVPVPGGPNTQRPSDGDARTTRDYHKASRRPSRRRDTALCLGLQALRPDQHRLRRVHTQTSTPTPVGRWHHTNVRRTSQCREASSYSPSGRLNG